MPTSWNIPYLLEKNTHRLWARLTVSSQRPRLTRKAAVEFPFDKTQRLVFDGRMPTIVRRDGFRVVIIPGDHIPPHVHVYYGDGEMVVYLDTLAIREHFGLKAKEAAKA